MSKKHTMKDFDDAAKKFRAALDVVSKAVAKGGDPEVRAIAADLADASSRFRTWLFRKVAEEEYGKPS